MFEMQTFHQWLSSPTPTPDVHRRRLERLTQIPRTRILQVTNQTTWYIWSAEEAAPEPAR